MLYNTLIKIYQSQESKSLRLIRFEDMKEKGETPKPFLNTSASDDDYVIDGVERAETLGGDYDRDFKKDSIARAKRMCKEIIRNNYSKRLKMLTLTYAKGTLDRKKIFSDIKNMCTRFRLRFKNSLRYIATLELHESGKSFHIHMIIDCDYIDSVLWSKELWQQGFITINTISWGKSRSECLNAVTYVLKYIHKSADSHDFYDHLYLRSHNWDLDIVKEYCVTKNDNDMIIGAMLKMGCKRYKLERFNYNIYGSVFVAIVDVYAIDSP